MVDVCVVHLVRAKNGFDSFQQLVGSYVRNPGGMEHDLAIVFKGFPGKTLPREYRQALSGIPHRSLFVWDFGYDIRPYLLAARKFDDRYFCFLNSNSILLDKDWLVKMYQHASSAGVGLVGATGSHASWLTDFLNIQKTLRALPDYRGINRNLRRWLRLQIYRRHYDPFPNYHVRTNAFLISREVLERISCPAMISKSDAYRFESGKNSLTKQVLFMNLRALVVGKDGRGYEKEEWGQSNTFWQGDQGNLLVADKQTTRYLQADPEERQHLSRVAWGTQ